MILIIYIVFVEAVIYINSAIYPMCLGVLVSSDKPFSIALSVNETVRSKDFHMDKIPITMHSFCTMDHLILLPLPLLLMSLLLPLPLLPPLLLPLLPKFLLLTLLLVVLV